MLTTKKFIKEVEKMGFTAIESSGSIQIRDSGYLPDADIYTKVTHAFDTKYEYFQLLSESDKERLFDLLVEYARTPIEDREEPQKYYLRFTALTKKGFCNYLNYNPKEETIFLDNRTETRIIKTQFTQAEIDEIKEKFKVTLWDFEQIPIDWEE